MDPIALILGVLLMATIVLAPILGAEDRPDFKRPDRKARRMVSSRTGVMREGPP